MLVQHCNSPRVSDESGVGMYTEILTSRQLIAQAAGQRRATKSAASASAARATATELRAAVTRQMTLEKRIVVMSCVKVGEDEVISVKSSFYTDSVAMPT
jgi:hypothetical protein